MLRRAFRNHPSGALKALPCVGVKLDFLLFFGSDLAIEDEIRAKFGDVDSTIVDNERFFAALGRIAFLWAGIESSLDMCMAKIHQDLGGADLEPEMPFSLQRKLKFLRKAARTLPALSKSKNTWREVLIVVQRESKNRNQIIHSFATTEFLDGRIGMVQLIRSSDALEYREFYTSTETLEKVVASTVRTANMCLWLSSLFLDEHRKPE